MVETNKIETPRPVLIRWNNGAYPGESGESIEIERVRSCCFYLQEDHEKYFLANEISTKIKESEVFCIYKADVDSVKFL